MLDKNTLKELLVDNLTIDLEEDVDMYNHTIKVTIKFDNKEICNDTLYLREVE